MVRSQRVPLIVRQSFIALQDSKRLFGNFHHHRVALYAERAITGCQLIDVPIDAEPHIAAMAGAEVTLQNSTVPSR